MSKKRLFKNMVFLFFFTILLNCNYRIVFAEEQDEILIATETDADNENNIQQSTDEIPKEAILKEDTEKLSEIQPEAQKKPSEILPENPERQSEILPKDTEKQSEILQINPERQLKIQQDDQSDFQQDVQIILSVDEPAVQVTTIYNGIDYGRVYDYSYYLDHNPDVKKAFKGDTRLTLKHFVDHGMKEGRTASGDFDVYSYSRSYKDLRAAFINDPSKYYMHYITYGYNEGRKPVGEKYTQGTVTSMQGRDYSDVYDYEYYINRYPDIKKYVSNKFAPDAAALEHFIDHGMKENRQASEDFDVISYSNAYPDLRRAYGQNSSGYYMHYISYGKKEARTASDAVELKNPITVSKGTDYSRIYDYDYYLQKYPDIKKAVKNRIAPDIAALDHFITYGMKEKRQASSDFDVVSYYRSYQDLRVAFHNDYPKYYEHYLKNGYKENRRTIGEKKLQNPVTKYAGVEFKSIYDYNYYIGKYSDLSRVFGEDDIDVLHHFVKYGINEGRTAKESFNKTDYNRLKTEAKDIIIKENIAKYKYSYDRLLTTAMMPVGQTMYIYGGGWNEPDTGAGPEAVSIGLSPRWKEYADAQNSSYDYRKTRYQIHDGLDCSGYIGWLVYNSLNEENGHDGYVSQRPNEIMISKGLGYTVDTNTPKPGDICVMGRSHVWLSLGCCEDGSILLAHSSPPGCSICGTLLPDGSRSQAVRLAESVMRTHFPEWYNRYPNCTRNYSYITKADVFRFNSSTLADPNNLQNMSANEIVDYLFR